MNGSSPAYKTLKLRISTYRSHWRQHVITGWFVGLHLVINVAGARIFFALGSGLLSFLWIPIGSTVVLFLWLVFRILQGNTKKELLWSLWV